MARRRRKRAALAVTPPGPPGVSPRAARLCGLGVFAAILTVCLLTITPTVVDQDSGELVAAAHVLGIPHPTGYPLWTMLARGFDLLPVGHTSAYRVALLSAVATAGGAALVCRLVSALTGLLLPGVVSGLSFALWFPTWSQAVRPEVYALGGLLFVLFLVALRPWDRERSARALGWLALASGFAVMHHRTLLLALGPCLAVAFWCTQPRRGRIWARATMLFLAPFLCYLYLPIRAAAAPPLNWGRPDTLDRFLHHALGRQYGHFLFANSLEAATRRAAGLVGDVLAGSGWESVALALVGVPLIIWGFAWWYRQRSSVVASLAAGSVLLCVWVLGWGAAGDPHAWLLPVGAVVAVFGGIGLARASSLLSKRRAGGYVAGVLGAMVCLLLLTGNWARADQSDVWRYRDRWAAVLSQLEENAVFIAEFDVPMFATHYLQQVEGLRKDIVLLSAQDLWHSWYVESIADPELRSASEELWEGVNSDIDIEVSNTPEFWQGTALLAHRLAQHYGGRRPVYALHGWVTSPIQPPPYFVSLSEDLVRLDFELPDLLHGAEEAGEPIVEFPGGLKLMSFETGKSEAHAGEIVEFRVRWRTESPLSGEIFGIRLAPRELRDPEGETASKSYWGRLSAKGQFVQGFPVAYGLRGLAASPPGTIYEQKGSIIIPSNAPSGEYVLEIGFAPSYPPQYQEWCELGEEAVLRVRARPLPTNGA